MKRQGDWVFPIAGAVAAVLLGGLVVRMIFGVGGVLDGGEL